MANGTETKKVSDIRESEARVRRIEGAAERTAHDARDMAEQGADTTVQAAEATVDVARRAAEHGRDTVEAGVRAAARANAALAEAGYGEGRRLIEASARVTDLYRGATEASAEDVQALVASCAQLGQGIQRMQHAWLDVLQRSLARARRQPQDLLRCRSAVELAEVQRDLYLDGVALALESSTTLLRLAGEVVQGAAQPLETRARRPARA